MKGVEPVSDDVLRFGRIRAKRVNIIDENGTLRLAIANKERTANPIIGGKEIVTNRRPSAGIIFFNEDGDECGGLIFGDKWAHMSFDQYQQDQIVAIQYRETPLGQHSGLTVWDRPDRPVSEFLEKYLAIEAMPEGAEKEAAMALLRSEYHSPVRMYMGREADGSSSVVLADSKGNKRVAITVGPDGVPSILMFDEKGEVVESLVPDISYESDCESDSSDELEDSREVDLSCEEVQNG